jgi:thiol-disulfide isomerase/thioredoxin
MPVILRRLVDESGDHISWGFWCPGCRMLHCYATQRRNPKDIGPVWEWNGSEDKPTFTPSLLNWGSRPEQRCHLFVTDGKICYCGDCHHDLKGQTVDMVDFDTLSP